MTRFYTELIVAVALISALLVWGPASAASLPGVAGEKQTVGVVCVQEGIDAFHEATKVSDETVENVLSFLFSRGLCMHNPQGFRVILKKLYKEAYRDHESGMVEIWQVETEEGPDVFTWNYMGMEDSGLKPLSVPYTMPRIFKI